MHTSAPLPPVAAWIAATGSVCGTVDGVRRAELLGPLELAVVEVDGDDRGRAGELGAGDRGVADAAAAEHGDAVAALHLTGEHRRADAGHHAAAEQAGDLRLGGRVDRRALAGGDERLLGERADARGGRQRRAVLERHLLRRVERAEAQVRLALDGTSGTCRRPRAS